MIPQSPDDVLLPPLREDLRIESAAPLASGAPVWVIYDPARHRYFQIGRRTVEMLSTWTAGTVGALKKRLTAERGWAPGERELTGLIRFLFQNELTAAPIEGRSTGYANRAAAARRNAFLALAKAYLFFRVPLLRPERWLEATAPLARPFFTRGFAIFALICGLIGIGMASRQLDAFLAYAQKSISLEGAAYYAVALVIVKFLHELGHAYQATLRGVRVTTMGVAFMVMLPLLYTDVSDAWRTRNRRDKLMIDAGGVMVELALAAIATLVWVFLPDGPMRSVAFAVATTSWLLSLFVNLNPFMRFDGYYFLGDAMGLQNLQPRSFALARWRLREFLFGLGHPAPERLTGGMRRFMVVYAICTWAYRLFLFIGIALIVYNLFFKALGVLLFAVEIAFFIALPIAKEIAVWFSLRDEIVRSPRAWVTGLIFSGLIVFIAVPQPVTVRAPAMLTYEREAAIYPNAEGLLVGASLSEGAVVAAGDALAMFASPEIDAQIRTTKLRIELLELRLGRVGADARERGEALVFARELESERARLDGLLAEQALSTLTAPFDGLVVDVDPLAAPGAWLGRGDRLAIVVDPGGLGARGYVEESDLARFAVGAEGVFIPDDPSAETLQGRVAEIDRFATERLDPAYLAATNGGAIPVSGADDGGPPAPDGSWFAARFALEGGPSTTSARVSQARRGVFFLRGARESWARRAIDQVARVLLRELGV